MENIELRRSERRGRTFKDGKVVLANWSTIDCVVRDLTATGARLRFPNPTSVPDTFHLLIQKDEVLIPAERTWSQAFDVGVHFTGPAKRAPPRRW